VERENPRLLFTDEELTPELERYAKRAERAADKAEKARARIEKGRKKVKRRMVIQNAAGVGRDKAGPVRPERPKTEHIPSKDESDPLFDETGQPAVSKTFEDEQILHFEKAERAAPISKRHHDLSGSQRESAESGNEEKHRSFEETSQPEPASPFKENFVPSSKVSHDAGISHYETQTADFSKTEAFDLEPSDAKRPSRDKADQPKRRKSNLRFEETDQSKTSVASRDRKDRKGLNFEEADKAARRSKLRHDAENAAASGSAVPPKAGKSKQTADGLSPSKKTHGHAAAEIAAAPLRAAQRRVHQEIAEHEDDNVGLESVHKMEKSAETSGRLLTHSSRSRKLRLYRKAGKAEKRLEKANVTLLYRKSLRDDPQLASNPLSRWQQKRRIKKQYAAKLREQQKAGGAACRNSVKTARDDAKKAVEETRKTVDFILRHKKGLAIIGIGFVVLTLLLSIMSSCSTLLEGGLSILSGSTYPSADEDVLGAEAEYARMEAELQEYVNDYEDTHDYNEYVYEVDPIRHDPYVLTALLSALHPGGWMLSSVEDTLETIFDLQYVLTETVTEETRYDDDNEPYTYTTCTVKLENTDMSHLPVFLLDEGGMSLYATYMATGGNRPDLFPASEYPGAVQRGDYLDYDVPPEALEDETFAAMLAEAEKYLGFPYVWGGASPATSFDCSGYVSWVINHSGWNYGRLTAQGLYNVTTPVTVENARPGDLVFFKGTYNTTEVSHVGIYVGNHRMIHAGDPISYADLNENYWQQHIFCYGRLS